MEILGEDTGSVSNMQGVKQCEEPIRWFSFLWLFRVELCTYVISNKPLHFQPRGEITKGVMMTLQKGRDPLLLLSELTNLSC